MNPQHTALLVMDFQPGIVSTVERARGETPLDAAATAVALARQHGVRVAYVRVGFTDDDVARIPAHSPMAGAASGGRRVTMHADHPDTAVHERLAPAAGDIVVRKTRVGAFSTTDLDEQLRAAGVTALVLAGLSTSGVVLSTVREAADRDYRLVVLADACADPAPGVHEFLTEKIFPRQAEVTTTDRLAALLTAP